MANQLVKRTFYLYNHLKSVSYVDLLLKFHFTLPIVHDKGVFWLAFAPNYFQWCHHHFMQLVMYFSFMTTHFTQLIIVLLQQIKEQFLVSLLLKVFLVYFYLGFFYIFKSTRAFKQLIDPTFFFLLRQHPMQASNPSLHYL